MQMLKSANCETHYITMECYTKLLTCKTGNGICFPSSVAATTLWGLGTCTISIKPFAIAISYIGFPKTPCIQFAPSSILWLPAIQVKHKRTTTETMQLMLHVSYIKMIMTDNNAKSVQQHSAAGSIITKENKSVRLCLPVFVGTILPPILFLASSILKFVTPFLTRWLAAERPAIPAPMINILHRLLEMLSAAEAIFSDTFTFLRPADISPLILPSSGRNINYDGYSLTKRWRGALNCHRRLTALKYKEYISKLIKNDGMLHLQDRNTFREIKNWKLRDFRKVQWCTQISQTAKVFT